MASCEHSNEPSGLIKGGEFLDCVTLTFSRNTVPLRDTYLYAATVLFSFLLFSVALFLVTDIYFMWEVRILEIYQKYSSVCAESHFRIYHPFWHLHVCVPC